MNRSSHSTSSRTRRGDRSTYDRALDMLESRARSAVELRRALIRKGEPASDVDSAIERLLAAGLLDDADYARQVARTKALGAGQSRRRIGQELARRGVERAVADAAIADVFEDESIDETTAIDRVGQKKLKSLSKLDEATQRRRLYAFLARRGYDSDAITGAVRRVLGDGSEDARE